MHKTSEKDFTRNRKMGFVDIILFQISNASKSFGVELHKYLRSSKIRATAYSKQAYSKARMKIKPQICIRKALMHIRLTRSKRLYYCSLNLLGTNAKTE